MKTLDIEAVQINNELVPLVVAVGTANNGIEVYEGDQINFYKMFNRDKAKTKYYIHNLCGYDWFIIKHQLDKAGFKHIQKSTKTVILNKEQPLEPLYYTYLGGNHATYVGVDIWINGKLIQLRDSLKIFSLAQDKVLKMYGFDPKVDVDWDSITEHNYREHMPLIRERCVYDVMSLYKCLELFNKTLEELNTHGDTASSIAMNAFKHVVAKSQGYDAPSTKVKNELFKDMFSVMSDRTRQISRSAYQGGYTAYNPKYKNKVVNDVVSIDTNSSYPNSMAKAKIPTNVGRHFLHYVYDEKYYHEYVVDIDITLKRGHEPIFSAYSNNILRRFFEIDDERAYKKTERLEKFKGIVAITEYDLHNIKNFYKIKSIRYLETWQYKCTNLLQDFIRKLYALRVKAKKEGSPLQYTLKIILNSLYGKFAQDLTGRVDIYTAQNRVLFSLYATDTEPYPVHVANAIVSHARTTLLDVIKTLRGGFIYSDTDSVYAKRTTFEKNRHLIDIDPDRLGAWGIDAWINRMKVIGKKCYAYETDDSTTVKCVGLPAHYRKQFTVDTFIEGAEIVIRKMKHIVGGKVMANTVYTLKERIAF